MQNRTTGPAVLLREAPPALFFCTWKGLFSIAGNSRHNLLLNLNSKNTGRQDRVHHPMARPFLRTFLYLLFRTYLISALYLYIRT